METITIIVDTVVDLVKAVLSPLGHLGDYLDSIFDVFEGSSDLSSADVDVDADAGADAGADQGGDQGDDVAQGNV